MQSSGVPHRDKNEFSPSESNIFNSSFLNESSKQGGHFMPTLQYENQADQ